MTTIEEALQDEIIQAHKNNHNVFEWASYIVNKVNLGTNYRDIMFVKYELLRKELISFYLDSNPAYRLSTQLTLKGQDWISSMHEKKLQVKKKRSEYFSNIPKKYSIVFGIIGYIGGILSNPITEQIFPKKTTVDTIYIKQTKIDTRHILGINHFFLPTN